VNIKHVRLSKQSLDAMPDGERTLLILLGHATNELNVLVRLIVWSGNANPSSPLEERGDNTIALFLLRLFSGKLFEVWALMKKAFFSSKAAKAYEGNLSEEEAAALSSLKKYFGRGTSLGTVRNQYSFHYSPDRIKASYAAIDPDEELDLYVGETEFDTLHHFADVIVNRAMLNDLNATDHGAALATLRQDSLDVHSAATAVMTGLMVQLVRQYMGATFDDLAAKDIDLTPKHASDAVVIPFFVTTVSTMAQPTVQADSPATGRAAGEPGR
jgi:hypothetical protein